MRKIVVLGHLYTLSHWDMSECRRHPSSNASSAMLVLFTRSLACCRTKWFRRGIVLGRFVSLTSEERGERGEPWHLPPPFSVFKIISNAWHWVVSPPHTFLYYNINIHQEYQQIYLLQLK